MKKIIRPKWMKLLKVLHLLGMLLLCTGMLATTALQMQPAAQSIAFNFGGNFTRNGGILLLGTGLVYNLFTRYGWKQRWIISKWAATIVLIAVSVTVQATTVLFMLQLFLLLTITVLSVYKWQ